jgi:hypothetical protein
MTNPERSLATWIKEAMNQKIETQVLKAMSCVHKEGARDVEVFTVAFTDDKIWDSNTLAEMFVNKAQDHVAEIPGTQLFFLLGFYGDDTNRPRVRRSFRVNNSDSIEFGYGSSEPPNEMGQKMQGMRHIEFMYQQNMLHTRAVMDMQYRLIDRLGNGYQKSMAESHQVLELAKTVILSQASAEGARLVAESDKKERLEFIKMLPPLANRVLGEEIFPVATTDSKVLDSVLEKLDARKLEVLSAEFGPEVAGYLAMRAAKLAEEKHAAIELAKKATVGEKKEESANGADDPLEEFEGEIAN